MKLELPNGVSLSLWENEVDEINLCDSHIEVIRPSGRILKISLSDFWLKTISSSLPSSSSIPQISSSPPQNGKSSSLALTINPNIEQAGKSLKPCTSYQNALEGLYDALEKFSKISETNKASISALKEEMDNICSELKEEIRRVEVESNNGLSRVDGKLQDSSNNFEYVMDELREICSFLAQREKDEPREDFKKKKKNK